MGCGKPLTVAGSDQNLIKLGFKETVQRNIVWKEERMEAVRPRYQSVGQQHSQGLR